MPVRRGARWRRTGGFHDLLALHSHNPQRYPFLLESVMHGTPQARYDILFAWPGERIVQAAGESRPLFLERLASAFEQQQRPRTDDCPLPFHGGWFLYLGYELARTFERALRNMPTAYKAWPVALAVRCPAAVIRDHHAQQTWLVADDSRTGDLEELEQDLAVSRAMTSWPLRPDITAWDEEDPALYLARIARVHDYIRNGDTYQVNLSRRWWAEFASAPSPAALYARLREANPAPFAGLVMLDDRRAIISSSPERLVEVRHGRISTRPIAGSWPRHDNDADLQQTAALRRHPKERAEHIMLVDLERNDLGRICQAGTVRADDLLTVESYRHVHHLVSGISGRLRPGITPTDVIRAMFPGGTITGCPKIRTMQIIAELEGEARGAYTGSMGYLNCDGSMDLNILIRTLMLDGQRAEWRAGGGIVADSDPMRELHETRAKAKGLLRALALDPRHVDTREWC